MKPNHPPKLPQQLDYSLFIKEMGEAGIEVGRLDGRQKELVNPSLLITPLTAKEAEVSSKIEGTISTVSEIMSYEAGEISKNADTPIVASYRRAMTTAMVELEHRELNQAFIKQLHSILLENARGHEMRGKYRPDQVYIGKEHAPLSEATYIPPEALLLQEYMDNWEDYMLNNPDDLLVKVGIMHYQFEAIHPFKDGNGRIGRLLIPLFLYRKGTLSQPILYISGYFDRHREEYIDSLHQTDLSGKYEPWLKFFFKAIKEQSIETQVLIEKIKNLRRELEDRCVVLRSPYASKVVEFMFRKPVFTNSQLGEHIGSRVTAARITKKLEEMGVLSSSKTNKLYYFFGDLLTLL